jgi:hypothetical protein
MSEFAAELRERFLTAMAALDAARESGDEYAADVRAGELESLRRLARDHDVPLDDDRPESP